MLISHLHGGGSLKSRIFFLLLNWFINFFFQLYILLFFWYTFFLVLSYIRCFRVIKRGGKQSYHHSYKGLKIFLIYLCQCIVTLIL